MRLSFLEIQMLLSLKFKARQGFILKVAIAKSQGALKNIVSVSKVEFAAPINAYVMVAKIALRGKNILMVTILPHH